jgi:dienelactone hydrolase
MTTAEEVLDGTFAPAAGRTGIRGITEALRPGASFWTGAARGAMAGAILLIAGIAAFMRTGLGAVWDVLIAVGVLALVLLIARFIVKTFVNVARRVPVFVVAAIASAFIAALIVQISIGVPPPVAFVVTIPVLLLVTMLGAAVGALRGLNRASLLRKSAFVLFFIVAISLNVAFISWLMGPGTSQHLIAVPAKTAVAPLNAADPSQVGPFAVKASTYEAAPVDGTPFLGELTGFKQKMRRAYWGFDKDKLPVRGRVWAPEGNGPFPLVLIVHGNHKMEQASDAGYEYLGHLLASRGMIAASVDENFLNGSWSGDFKRKEIPARAWLILQHLKSWKSFNATRGNPFYGKVDLNEIALIGHSRGGEAVAVAAEFNKLSHYPDDANVAFDFNFPIKSVVAIAPTDDNYKPAGKPVVLENINYLVLQGAHDGDVSTFVGDRAFNRVKFSGDGYHFNASLFIYRANHSQFNTAWEGADVPPPFNALSNRRPLLSSDQQRRVAQVYVSAFLAATLQNRGEYLPMFRDYRTASRWLPDTIYVSQFNDSTFAPVCDYEEDADVATTTLAGGSVIAEGFKTWREQRIPLRDKGTQTQENNAVYLGWDKPSLYRVTLPAAQSLTSDAKLVFSVGNTSKEGADPDFTIELTSVDGEIVRLPFSRFASVTPRLKVQTSKMSFMENALLDPAEIVLQTYELPLADFAKADPKFNPAQLKSVAFRFDRARSGELALDRIGFRG